LNTIGILELAGEESLFSIDGQHRIEGVKQSIKENPERFQFDELPVIIVAHNDTKNGKIRTRRLFSEINTKAQKVSGLDDLITNEDNPVDINARKIFAEFEPFGKDKFIQLNSTININADAKEFTTILTLKEVNKILYSPLFKFQEVRPGDDVINGLFNVTLNFWTDAIANIPKYSEVLRPENPTVSVNVYRNRNGGSILFRPVGLKILAEVYVNWKNFHGETTGFWEVFNRIDDDLNGEYWKDVVWDNAKKKINKTSEKFLREYTKYLIGLPFDEEFTVLEYSKMKGVEDVTVQTIELPTQP